MKNIDSYYDEIASGYDELHAEEQKKKLAIIKAKIKPSPTDKLLDVGCGSGISSNWQCGVYGIDPSKELIKIARQNEKPKNNFYVASAEDIPFPDNYFDYVISVTAIQNFSDIKLALSEMLRVGKDSFVISYLKRSQDASKIESAIKDFFEIVERIERFGVSTDSNDLKDNILVLKQKT